MEYYSLMNDYFKSTGLGDEVIGESGKKYDLKEIPYELQIDYLTKKMDSLGVISSKRNVCNELRYIIESKLENNVFSSYKDFTIEQVKDILNKEIKKYPDTSRKFYYNEVNNYIESLRKDQSSDNISKVDKKIYNFKIDQLIEVVEKHNKVDFFNDFTKMVKSFMFDEFYEVRKEHSFQNFKNINEISDYLTKEDYQELFTKAFDELYIPGSPNHQIESLMSNVKHLIDNNETSEWKYPISLKNFTMYEVFKEELGKKIETSDMSHLFKDESTKIVDMSHLFK